MLFPDVTLSLVSDVSKDAVTALSVSDVSRGAVTVLMGWFCVQGCLDDFVD